MVKKLQVLTVTRGEEGIKRIATCSHPRMPEVEYVVSWQNADMDNIPEELSSREDFKIFPASGSGICNNRNEAFRHAQADYLLIADDDLDYTTENLQAVIESFESHPQYSFLTFEYDSPDFPRSYPDREFDFDGKIPKGYYVTSFEIGFNLALIRRQGGSIEDLRFNPWFGINGKAFGSGEEDILIAGLVREGKKGRFIKKKIATHKGSTTGMRMESEPAFIMTKGAVMTYVKPGSWFLRMFSHAWRASKAPKERSVGFHNYCRWWMQGVRAARRNRVFDDAPPRLSGTLLILGVIACFGILMSIFTTNAYDDWIFMAEWRNVNGSEKFSFQGMLNFWEHIRLYDNGRIANVMAPFTTLFSPWKEVFPYLNGIAVALMVALASMLSFGRKWRTPICMLAAWVLMLFFLPWRNSIFVADYSLNYIWSAVLTMTLILLTLRWQNKGWSCTRLAICILLAAIAGGWHEGFAVPTLVGFLALTLISPRRYGYQWWAIGLVYAASTAFFLFCPGMLQRTSEQMGDFSGFHGIIRPLADFAPAILLFIAVVLLSAIREKRPMISSFMRTPIAVIGGGIIVVGILLSLLVKHTPRSAFWPDLISVVLLLKLFSPVEIRSKQIRQAVTAMLIVIAVVPMTAATLWQYRFYREARAAISGIEDSDSGTVFMDLTPAVENPFYALKIPEQAQWVTPFHYHCIKEYNGKPYPAVVPEMLNLADIDSGDLLQSNVDVRRFGHYLVSTDEKLRELDTMKALIIFDSGASREVNGGIIPYITTGGLRLAYIVPYGVSEQEIKHIESIEITVLN